VSYEEEHTCHMRGCIAHAKELVLSYEEEDTCHMRRSIHVI
jgi:hypothetical protein